MKFGLAVSEEKAFENINRQTEAQTNKGQKAITTAHPEHSSGELKIAKKTYFYFKGPLDAWNRGIAWCVHSVTRQFDKIVYHGQNNMGWDDGQVHKMARVQYVNILCWLTLNNHNQNLTQIQNCIPDSLDGSYLQWMFHDDKLVEVITLSKKF